MLSFLEARYEPRSTAPLTPSRRTSPASRRPSFRRLCGQRSRPLVPGSNCGSERSPSVRAGPDAPRNPQWPRRSRRRRHRPYYPIVSASCARELPLGGLMIASCDIDFHLHDYADARPDPPVPFGPKTAWLALETTDTDAVASALGPAECTAATWRGASRPPTSRGLRHAAAGDWTLAVSTACSRPTGRRRLSNRSWSD